MNTTGDFGWMHLPLPSTCKSQKLCLLENSSSLSLKKNNLKCCSFASITNWEML
jgi:hypothetical protein